MNIKSRITGLLEYISRGIYEKNEAIALTLLASIAGESIFLLGPPGVAKSLIARRLKDIFEDGKAFEYLMSRFSTPDEIFGPVSISKLKDGDKYERNITNYLPDATVVFLDEIWKAGPSIQNALLTVLNEKIFRNGEQTLQIPMKALISASNELPATDEGLDALWDRFLVRLVVKNIKNLSNFDKMISLPINSNIRTIPKCDQITSTEYAQWSEEIDKIGIPGNVFEVIHEIKRSASTHNRKAENADKKIYISDRRWRKIIRLLRTSAFLNERAEIDLMDCFLIAHCLWNEENQIKTVAEIVNVTIENQSSLFISQDQESLDFNKMEDKFRSITTAVEGTMVKEGGNVSVKKPYKIGGKIYYRILNARNIGGKLYEYIDKDTIDKLKNQNATGTDYLKINLVGQDGGISPDLFIKMTRKNDYFISTRGDSAGYIIYLERYDGFEITLQKEPDVFTKTKIDDDIRCLLEEIERLRVAQENHNMSVKKRLKSHLFVPSSSVDVITYGLNKGLERTVKLKTQVLDFQGSYSNSKVQINGS